MILFRVDLYGYCELDVEKSQINKLPKEYNTDKSNISGLYYEYEDIFFALYEKPNGSIMYYDGKEYPLTPELTITVNKESKERHFSIKEYGIEIDYPEPKYLWDEFSTEEDIDLFVKIANNYKDKSFYELFTSKE